MDTITRHSDPATLDDCGRQVRGIVTPDTDAWDAALNLIGARDADDLTDAGRKLAEDYGIDMDSVADFGIGDYMEGQVLDYRYTCASDGTVIEVALLTGFGGPNVWEHIGADGDWRCEVYWWGTRGTGEYQHDLHAAIFDYMVEVIGCT